VDKEFLFWLAIVVILCFCYLGAYLRRRAKNKKCVGNPGKTGIVCALTNKRNGNTIPPNTYKTISRPHTLALGQSVGLCYERYSGRVYPCVH